MHGFLRYFNNTSWMLVERLVRLGLSFIVGVALARHLGTDQFGLLSFALSFVGLFADLATLGIDSILARELLVRGDAEENKLQETAAALRLAGGFLVLILATVGAQILRVSSTELAMVIIAAAAFLLQSIGVLEYYYQAKVLSRFMVWGQLVQQVVSASAKIVLIILNAPIVWFAATTI